MRRYASMSLPIDLPLGLLWMLEGVVTSLSRSPVFVSVARRFLTITTATTRRMRPTAAPTAMPTIAPVERPDEEVDPEEVDPEEVDPEEAEGPTRLELGSTS